MKMGKLGAAVFVLLLVAAGMALAGGQAEGAAPEVVTLQWQSYWTTDARGQFIPAMIEAFHEKNSNIRVEYTGASTHMDDLKRAFAVGDPPDLFGTTRTYYHELATEGLLYDLTDTYERNGWLDRFAGIVDAWNRIDGKLYGVSGLIVPTVWHYNKTMFDSYGLSAAADFDGLLVLGKKLGEHGVEYPLLTTQLINLYGAISCQVAGLDPVVEEDFTDPGLMESARIFQRIVDSGILDPSVAGMDLASAYPVWGAGNGGIFPMHTGITTNLKKAAGDSFEIDLFFPGVKFTKEPKGWYSVSGGMIWAMPSGGENDAQALKLLEYLMSYEVTSMIAEQGEITPDLQANADHLQDPVRLKAAKYLEGTNFDSMMFIDFISTRNKDKMKGLIREVVNGKMSAEDMMRELDK
jgi:ABC-type glycerol-3-phosphate transport system substrate-binding protein